MDGVLLIDKPSGPTSHDVVARIRSVTKERSVGHTGTLDPRATGLLPLVLGKATRLASVLTGGDKTYLASIRLGIRTTTDDADGAVTSTFDGALPELPVGRADHTSADTVLIGLAPRVRSAIFRHFCSRT